GGDATPATSAARRLRLIDRQIERSQNLSKEKPGAELRIDQHRAFTVPAEARFGGVVAFEDRPSVDITFLGSAEFGEKLAELLEFREHHVVVIVAPGVTRDSSTGTVVFFALP